MHASDVYCIFLLAMAVSELYSGLGNLYFRYKKA